MTTMGSKPERKISGSKEHSEVKGPAGQEHAWYVQETSGMLVSSMG